nr:8-oxoguanine deaminase [Candidatus Pantoea persica]
MPKTLLLKNADVVACMDDAQRDIRYGSIFILGDKYRSGRRGGDAATKRE